MAKPLPTLASRISPVFVVLCLQSVLLFWNLDLLPVWGDEIFTLQTVALPPAGIISTVRTADIHPPLYFLLLHYWARLPLPWTGVAALRAFSAVAALLATFLFDRFWLRRLKPGRRWLALLLFACSPCLLLYGRMARSYSMQTAIALPAISLLWRWLRQPAPALRRAVPAFAALILLLFTHYLPGIAVLAGFSLVAWRRLGFARVAWIYAAIAAASVPWLPALAEALRSWGNAAAFQSHYALTGNPIAEQGLKIASGLTCLTVGETFFLWSLALVPVILLLALHGYRARTLGPSLRPFLSVVAAIAYIGAARWVTWPFVAARLLWLLPFLTLALAHGIFRSGPLVRRIATVAILTSFATSAALYYRRENFLNLAYAAPVREIANRLKQEASAHDLILIDSYDGDSKALQFYLGDSLASHALSPENAARSSTLPPLAAIWLVRNTRDISPGHIVTVLQSELCHNRQRSDSFYTRYAAWQRSALHWVGTGAPPEFYYQLTVCR